MTVELLYLPGCPNHDAAADLVRSVLESMGLSAEYTETPVADYAAAQKLAFPGSPTLRVDGRDIEDVASCLPVGLACRTYFVAGEALGVPPRAWLERAVRVAHVTKELMNGENH
jgi:hypothetical protein